MRLAAALLALAVTAPAAQGAERGLVVAHHVFGPVPCGTPVVLKAPFTDPSVLAGSDPTACRILLNRRWAPQMPPSMRCTLVLHEYGHLAGREHSDDPDSVMYADYVRADDRCRAPLVFFSTEERAAGTSGSGPSSG
jgi:hypothetical protein